MVVVDTSALTEFLVGADDVAEQVRVAVRGRRIAVPHAADLECASALRGLVKGNKLPDAEAVRALNLLTRMNIRRFEHAPLLPRIWELRHNVWPYDAAYVALAEVLDAELITTDKKLATVPRLRCAVQLLQ